MAGKQIVACKVQDDMGGEGLWTAEIEANLTMFNRFAQYEDDFLRTWRRDGMPGLKRDSYNYIEFLTSPDDDQAPRSGTIGHTNRKSYSCGWSMLMRSLEGRESAQMECS